MGTHFAERICEQIVQVPTFPQVAERFVTCFGYVPAPLNLKEIVEAVKLGADQKSNIEKKARGVHNGHARRQALGSRGATICLEPTFFQSSSV